MVLAELGGRISRAIQQMNKVTVIDEKALNECLNEITRALLQSDVQFKMVMSLQQNIKKIVNLEELAAGHNKRIIIEKVRACPSSPDSFTLADCSISLQRHPGPWLRASSHGYRALGYTSKASLGAPLVVCRPSSLSSATCWIPRLLRINRRRDPPTSSCLSACKASSRLRCATVSSYDGAELMLIAFEGRSNLAPPHHIGLIIEDRPVLVYAAQGTERASENHIRALVCCFLVLRVNPQGPERPQRAGSTRTTTSARGTNQPWSALTHSERERLISSSRTPARPRSLSMAGTHLRASCFARGLTQMAS